jgi:putative oxidoreductase
MIQRMLSPFADRAYALLRMVSGALFAFHGVQKLFGVFVDRQPAVGTQLWVGGIIELVAGTAIALGLLTSWAAFLASGTMAVAYVQFHWKGAFDAMFFPAVNRGELAVVYSFLFLFVACRGAGPWSLDARRRRTG